MDEHQRAFAKALALLARRDHSIHEVRRKLLLAGFTPDTADQAIDRLRERSYLDDERYARQWAESAIRNGKGYGSRIRYELARKGVRREVVDTVVAETTIEHDEDEILATIVSRRFPGFDFRSADPREKKRVVGYLQRRGFSLSAILKKLPEMTPVED